MKILVIEDNRRVIKDITFCLQVRYPEAIIASAADGQKGLEAVESESPDLILIDSSLPDVDTLDLVQKIRQFSDVPLIILSETESGINIAKGLESGADEYIIKPFSPMEFLAKIKAVLRRTQGLNFKPVHSVSYGELSVNFNTQEVFLAGKQVKLTPIEYHLLSQLVRNEGRVLTNDTLLEKVWGSEYDSDRGSIKKYIYRLRSKLEQDASKPKMLLNERGIGYRFIKPGHGNTAG